METFLSLKTEYSITRSTITVKEGIKLAKNLGYKSVLLADDGNLFASLDFATEAIKNKIFPIVGVELKVQEKPIILIAKTFAGFQNLLELTYNSAITLDLILQKLEGVIVLFGEPEMEVINKILNYIPKSDFYIPISRLSNEQKEVEKESCLLEIAKNLELPIIYSNNAYFQKPEMFEPCDALKCIGEGRFLLEENREKFSFHNYFKSPSEIEETFADLPEALENANNLQFKISFVLKPSKPLLPSFAEDEKKLMEEKVMQGFEERLQNGELYGLDSGFKKEDYLERLKYEIEVISKMEFCGYFLIVADFINWSKNNNIPVGPGRGSGAGSVVAYFLKITDVDPLKYGLLFERFLNPDRISMPDFDVDFCPEGREKVINYVKEKYGNENVAGIITFGRLQARAVLKDVGRVMQLPYVMVDKICKLIPFNPVQPVTLEQAIEFDPELKKRREEDEQIAKLLDTGLKLEGLIRHASTHAAGVIIADRPLLKIVPLFRANEEETPAVGYHMKAAEMAGLVKFDFLGLKTLTIIAKTCKLVLEEKEVNLNPAKFPLKDSKTFELLQNGFTLGIFQLESLVCRDAMKKMKIDKLEDIIALTSLNRPGPMENIPSYINRKLGKEEISYPHPILEEMLKETYGIIIYQEQVIKLAQILAGYSLGEADLLRRAMGKKIKEEMEAQRKIFVEGAMKNNVPEQKASEIFDLVDKFAGYGFNKSHAAAYSIISYQMAYLKAHFPLQFFTANLNIALSDTNDLNLFISDARAMGVQILLPSINSCDTFFKIQNGKISYGLAALKSVGVASMQEIIEIRNKGGEFKNIFDFCERVGGRNANKKQLESLVKSGAFDCLAVNRRQILENVEILVTYASDSAIKSEEMSLFGDDLKTNPKLKEVQEFSPQEKLMNEFEAVGFYLSHHPLNVFAEKLESCGFTKYQDLESQLEGEREKRFLMSGVVSIVKQRSGARGRFAFVHLSDLSGMFEASIFKDELITKHREDLVIGKMIAIKASVSLQENGSLRIIINEISKIEDALIKLEKSKSQKTQINEVKKEIPFKPEISNHIQDLYSAKILRFKIEVDDFDFLKTLNEELKNFKQKTVLQKFILISKEI